MNKRYISRVVTIPENENEETRLLFYAVFEKKSEEVLIILPGVNHCECRIFRHLRKRENRTTIVSFSMNFLDDESNFQCPHILATLFAESVDKFGQEYPATKQCFKKFLAFQTTSDILTEAGFHDFLQP